MVIAGVEGKDVVQKEINIRDQIPQRMSLAERHIHREDKEGDGKEHHTKVLPSINEQVVRIEYVAVLVVGGFHLEPYTQILTPNTRPRT